jgi:hypothetical protein
LRITIFPLKSLMAVADACSSAKGVFGARGIGLESTQCLQVERVAQLSPSRPTGRPPALSLVRSALPVETFDAYARLSELLSSVSVKPEMRDLIYRVNWRKNSAVVHELIINRITTFASISISRATVTVDNIAPMLLEPPAEFVRLEMDHNTVQEWGKVFDREHVVRIYEELISIAGDNAARGEVR